MLNNRSLFFAAWWLFFVNAGATTLTVSALRVNSQINPNGVGETPRFSWIVESSERGKSQTAFHLLASSTLERLNKNEGDLWDWKNEREFSGILHPWAGKPLKSGQKVYWKVKVVDEKKQESNWSDSATFTVGPVPNWMSPQNVSSFKSSHNGLNQIFEIQKAVLAKRLDRFIKGETDALGDGAALQRAAREYLYHYDCEEILRYWLKLYDGGQNGDGFFPTAPGVESRAAGASDTGVMLSYDIWWMRGDVESVRKRWPIMEKHMMARRKADQTFRGRMWGEATGDFGTTGVVASPQLIDLCYLALSSRLMMELAYPIQATIKGVRYEDYLGRIRKSFSQQYFGEGATFLSESQTAQLFALRSGLVRPDQKEIVLKSLTSSLQSRGIEVGQIGAALLFPVLSLTGNIDQVFDLVTQEKEGMWTKSEGPFVGTGVTEWMMSRLAGIDASMAGFRRIHIAPMVPSDSRLKWVKAHHDSPIGRIIVNWELKNQGFVMNCTIPAGAIATLNLPAAAGQIITESGNSIENSRRIKLVKRSDQLKLAQILIQSGTYRFSIE